MRRANGFAGLLFIPLCKGRFFNLSACLRTGSLIGLLLLPTLAFAHASLVKSVPAQRAILLRAPAKIQLWFNEPLEPNYSTVSITDEAGKSIALSAIEVGGNEPKRIAAKLNALPAGRYTIKYRVLSVDGHIVQDQFVFTIKQ